MGFRELYTHREEYHFGPERRVEKPVYSILGVPFDSTSSYKPGSRFAPLEIRRAVYNIEKNSLFVDDSYLQDVDLEDVGDLAVAHGDQITTLQRLSAVVSEIAGEGKIPVVLGGEHTITYGVVEGLVNAGRKPCMVIFDAHFDLRDTYLGVKWCHATVMRRIMERFNPDVMYWVGVRGYEKAEADYAASRREIRCETSLGVKRIGPLNLLASIRRSLSGCEHIYVSIDMDAIDPAYAPGVANPEPLGITPYELLQILYGLATDARLIGLDLVEVSPPHDPSGTTLVLAGRIVAEALILNQLTRRGVKLPPESS